jgi:hypothetical protein
MSRHWPRLGLLLGALLLASLVVTNPVFAKTIIVDGDPSDWSDPPAQGPLINDPNEAPILENLDIGDVYFTNDTTNIYFRIDTLAGTNWSGTTMVVCLNTDGSDATGRADPLCNNAVGIDYIFQFISPDENDAPLFVLAARYCTAGGCVNFPAAQRPGVEGARQLPAATGTATEIGFPIAVLRRTQAGAAAANGIPSVCTSASPCFIPTRIILGNPAAEPDDEVSMLVGPVVPRIPADPTPVTLDSFGAARADGGVRLSWTTSSEIGVQGFHVLRSATGRREDATQVTQALIAAAGSGATGASYSFTDATAAPDAAYSYWLQTVSSAGGTEDYGPISYRPGLAAGTKIYLPAVRR